MIAPYNQDTGPDDAYQTWLDALEQDVIQDDFGYEPGEFTVFPSEWHALYAQGLSPDQAWHRTMDASAADREERDRRKAENWKRIQAANALIGTST